MTNSADQDLVESLLREYAQLSQGRYTFESHWEEIAQRVWPMYSGAFLSNGFGQVPGSKRNQHLYDSTAAIALQRFAAVNESLLTPSNERWHTLVVPPGSGLEKDRQVRLWMDATTQVLFRYRYSSKANFSAQLGQHYSSLGAFGTGALFIDDLSGEIGVRYKHVHLGELYCAENHQGLVDKVLRRFPLSARQAVQKFGDAVPAGITKALKINPEQVFWFLHCVKPREDMDPLRGDYKGMPFAAYYVSETGRKLLTEGGYRTFPYAVSRHVQAPGEVYGRSPAMDVLPAIKTLNEEKKTVLTQGHRAVNPIYLMHDDGILDTFSALPGTAVAGGVSAEGRPLIHPLLPGNVQLGQELMNDERAVINDAFYVTLFQILTETPQMTATEVLERVREKGILLAPTMGRQQSEFLGPLIDRELDVLARQGVLPPMPPALVQARGEYRVRYDSPLSRMQMAGELAGIQRTAQFAGEVFAVTQDPTVFDYFNWDTIIPDMAKGQGVLEKHMLGEDDVKAKRQARAAQQQQQQAIDAAPAMAGVMKALGPNVSSAMTQAPTGALTQNTTPPAGG